MTSSSVWACRNEVTRRLSATLAAHVTRLSEEHHGEPRSLAVQELWLARAHDVIRQSDVMERDGSNTLYGTDATKLARPQRGPAHQQKPAYLLNNLNACRFD
jgi:hypothetical protein